MMNVIWVGLVVVATLAGIVTGHLPEVQQSIFDFADTAVEIVIGLIGVLCFFSGLMKVAEEAGLTEKLARLLRPVMVRLFPDVPADHPAMAAIIMNIAANILGLGNAATPFGLNAMKELQTLNKTKDIATDAMVMFLAINTSSVTLIPTTVIALRSAAKSTDPSGVVGPIILATIISTATAIIAAKLLSKSKMWKLENVIERERLAGRLQLNENYVPWETLKAAKACVEV